MRGSDEVSKSFLNFANGNDTDAAKDEGREREKGKNL
jgi:hypothetical protein